MEERLLRLGQEWAAAERHGDVAFLNRTLADDFVGVGPLGFTLTKEQWLARHQSRDLQYTALTWDDVAVRRYGDAAVAVGRQKQQATYQGHDVRGEFRVTQIYVKHGEDWLVAGVQMSPIAGAPQGGRS